MSTTRPNVIQRISASLTKSKSAQHAETLQGSISEVGATPISQCVGGQESTVSGVLRSVTLRPRETVPAVEAELYDGSGKVRLVWLGRRQILGITPGRSIVVTGRITCNETDPTIFNPRYELRAISGAS
ncbi:MAG TPA: OB-fold nucleic acid binding domain-containing protein [Candidatus Limnocylindrales bacterium]|nr:OB-fold nucleic acid binding domain-containing protein [Candidatus Limnocylindrales bacterium]